MSTQSASRGRTLRVAGIQVESRNGEGEGNLDRAGKLAAQAAAEGARLILCPEFLFTGYIYDPSIWRSAEPRDGPTERWLRSIAVARDVYIGASYMEADGEDFFNTFTLAAPDGRVAGRVRKESLPGFEGWYFRGSPDSKVIRTDLGNIAVGVCQDNHTARFLRRLSGEDIDLLLMPHSAPSVRGPMCLPVSPMTPREALQSIASYCARAFGAPAVLANKWSAGESASPIPVLPFAKLRFRFPGLSLICDRNGAVLDQREDGEGIVIAEVELDPDSHRRPQVPAGYWSNPPERFARTTGAMLCLLERWGKSAYARSKKRRAAARVAAAGVSTLRAH